jgi:23S rRNA maturation-related 3'-5' exoribonuclease YhaM
MLNFSIISKVEFEPISQEVIEQMIRDQVKAQNPQVHINSITFIQRRDPVRIEAVVDAQLGAPAVTEVIEPVKEEVFPEVKEEVVDPVKPVKEEEVEEPVKSVADIFNMPS